MTTPPDPRLGGPSTVPPPDAVPAQRHPDAPAPGTKIESHYAYCFGCGDRHDSGLGMTLTAGEGVTVTAEFAVTGEHQGAPGLAHGGLLACAFDEALGTLVWLLRTPAVTGRLETDFLRPVPVGSHLLITSRATALHGRKLYADAHGRLDAPDGPVAVRAAAVFVMVDITHFARHGRSADIDSVRRDPTLHRSAEAFDVNP